ncbi:acyltransferase domain-containing protein, partial [Streptomyces albus]
AHQTALTHLWHTLGITFTHTTGHSTGEIAAATLAGILTPQDAATLITTRAHLMQNLPHTGTMLTIQATPEEITPTLTEHVSLAAVNGPQSVVVSGTVEEVQHIGELWRKRGRRTQQLRVSHAFHSPLMDPILDQLADTLHTLTYHQPTLPFTGTANSPHPPTTPHYWLDHT